MLKEELESLLSQGEGIRVEFKEANKDIPLSLYETVVSFLNKDGGVILLGVTDGGVVMGIPSDVVEQMKQNITTACNNSEFINPPLSLTPLQVEHDWKLLLALKIPVSSQVHMLKGVVFDRENDGDIKIVDHTRISNIYFRKRDV